MCVCVCRDLRLHEVVQNHEHVRVWVPWASTVGKLPGRVEGEESDHSSENGVELTLAAGAIASFQADGSVIVRVLRSFGRGEGEVTSGWWCEELTVSPVPLIAAPRRRKTSCRSGTATSSGCSSAPAGWLTCTRSCSRT